MRMLAYETPPVGKGLGCYGLNVVVKGERKLLKSAACASFVFEFSEFISFASGEGFAPVVLISGANDRTAGNATDEIARGHSF